MTKDEKLRLFYKDPCEEPEIPNNFSSLYLLRRDIASCFSCNIIWPGVMVIFTGIDLLAKFYSGDDKLNKSGERFKKYINEFISKENGDDEILWNLRNSMMHSYGLFTLNDHKFILDRSGKLIEKQNNLSKINVNKLKTDFCSSIESSKHDISKNVNLDIIFDKYGYIRIG